MSEMAQRELPEGWTFKPIGEIVQPTRPRVSPAEKPDLPFLGMDHIEAQTMRLLGSVPASSMKSSAVHFQPGDVLYGRLRPYLNKVFQPTFEGLCSAEFIVFPEMEELDNKYLQYFLNSSSFVRYATSLNSGDRPRVKFEQFSSHCIPLPPTVDDQKRIVAKIEELFSHIDAGVEGLKKTQRLLKQYRQSVLKTAVTGELTTEWREENKDKLESASVLLERILEQRKAKGKYKESVEYRFEGELPPIPSTWMWVSPEQIASADDYALAIGPFGSNLKVFDYRDDGVPLVFVRNIRSHNYDKQTAKYVTPEKAEELKAHSVSGGDVLITKMGEPPGDASIYPKTEPDAIITADCIKWRLSSLIDCPELYVHIVNSQLIRDQIVQRTKGVAQKKISLGTFRSIAFPLPPVEEQREILRVIEEKMGAADRLLREIERQLVRAERNKQSVLKKSFLGI
ncbi:restriction endonuclease subunit S [Thiothrix sp.]|jgi:type I restriction enzyme S subunit|uniref:restriction endonuclease subunit S n=1 Tax=Thiothrix sp. TaxID=1032 RepID=UPI00257BE1AE|nr:restriction endonuclease subunit S [Thiothrix sp.]